MRLINYRERSAQELRLKLKGDGYEECVINAVLARMQELGLQSDARYAEMYVRGRWRTTLRSPRRLQHELKMKGVAAPDIEAALSDMFGSTRGVMAPAEGIGGDWGEAGEEDEVDEAAHRQGLAWEALVDAARRRAELLSRDPRDKRRAKLARWLQYRGHSWDTVSAVFKDLEM